MEPDPRYILRARARYHLVQALVDFEKEHGALTEAEWLWVFQLEQNALIERLIQAQKSANTVEDSDG